MRPGVFGENRIGEKRNRLKVIGITYNSKRRKLFVCKCDCGEITTAEPALWERGVVKSCGCLSREKILEHTDDLDRLRRIWNGMVQRCHNKNCAAYKYYGEKGVIVCDEWRANRESFIEWALANGYDSKLTIDRINVYGNYEPGNCKWATYKEQAHNKRENPKKPERKPKTIVFDGEIRIKRDVLSEFGLTGEAVRYRMKTYGLDFESAVKMPRKAKGRPKNA